MGGRLPDDATRAISPTFDGGLSEHVELVGPLLADAGVRATFFVTVPALLERPAAWRNLAQSGHEIGCHCHFGVSEDGELARWSLQAVLEDLHDSCLGIAQVTGYLPTSFAFAGGRSRCSDGDFSAAVRDAFATLRTTESGLNRLDEVDPKAVKCLTQTGDATNNLPSPGEWSVPVFSHIFRPGFETAEDDLRRMLDAIASSTDLWAAPFGEVAARLTSARV